RRRAAARRPVRRDLPRRRTVRARAPARGHHHAVGRHRADRRPDLHRPADPPRQEEPRMTATAETSARTRGHGVRAEGVTKCYGRSLVVDDVHLDLPLGGVTALIGPNGAGKSTLLSIVGRLLGADAGRVSVAGLDVATTRGDELAKRLAVLRQDNHLDIRLTVRDLVTFGRYPHSKGRPTAEDLEHVERALAYLDLTELADRFLDQLSGGQRQRAFVAMVLCQDTDVILLDEPLNNLDLRHAVAMMGRLR